MLERCRISKTVQMIVVFFVDFLGDGFSAADFVSDFLADFLGSGFSVSDFLSDFLGGFFWAADFQILGVGFLADFWRILSRIF